MAPDQNHLAQMKTSQLSLGTQHSLANENSLDSVDASVIIVCLVFTLVTLIVAASLWPADIDDKIKRQRNYARADDLYFPLQGIVVSSATLDDLKAVAHNPENLTRQLNTFLPIDLRLVSLSLGGCAIKCEKHFEKGELLILRLNLLPDFPNQHEAAVYRVAWTRRSRYPDKDTREKAGLQLVESFNDRDRTSIKQYLSYLLDEPVV